MLEYKTKITEIKYLTASVFELTVALVAPEQAGFVAGQFMQFKIGEELKAYSIISLPDHNKELKFCIGLLDNGKASAHLKRLKLGDEIDMRGPAGNFVVDDLDKKYFFIATGVGVAPFASIVPDMLGKGYSEKARLLFGLRHEQDVFYFDRFSHLQNLYPNFTFTPTLTSPQSHWPGEVGRVTTYIEVAYEYYKDYSFYISGRQEMVNDMKTILLDKGHNPSDIKVEIFV